MKQKGFVKGAIILIIFNLIGKIIGAIYRIPLANLLGSVGIGEYQLVFPLYSLMLAISVSGIPVAISKIVSEYNSKGRFGDVKKLIKISVLYLVGVSVVCVLFVVFGARLIARMQGNSNIYICYYGIAPAILFVALLSVFRGYFQGYLNMIPTALSTVIEQVGRLIFGLFLAGRLVRYGTLYGVFGAVLGISFSELLALVFLIIYYFFHSRKQLKGKRTVLSTRVISRNLIKTALPITLGGIASPITSIIDSLLVVNMLIWTGFGSGYATSLLGLQSGIVDPLLNIPIVIAVSIAASVLPNLTNAYVKKDRAEVKEIIEKAFQISLSVSLACAICYVIFGRQILSFLYAKTLSEKELLISSKLLFLGGINLIFLSLIYVSASILQGMGKQKLAAKSTLIGSGIKVILTLALVGIKNINILGAMISGGASYIVVFLINYIKIKAETEARLSNLFFNLAIQECLVCLFAYFSNMLFGMTFGTKIALFAGGITAVIIFAISYYVLYLIEKPKTISSWLICGFLIIYLYEFKNCKCRIEIKCGFGTYGGVYGYGFQASLFEGWCGFGLHGNGK